LRGKRLNCSTSPRGSMNATLLDLPNETPEPLVSCADCPAVQRLERALDQLRADFRRDVGYWKSQHAKAVQRIEQLTVELEQSRGQVHALQDKLFGCKSEKSSGSDDVFAVGYADPLENQSTIVVDVVLGELCGGRREIA
jgi:hypothetical protein